MTVVIVTVVKVKVVIFVTLVIVTVATVAVGTVVIVTYFSKINLTPPQQMRYSQGSFSRFSRCFALALHTKKKNFRAIVLNKNRRLYTIQISHFAKL